jgi:hypothetical protein
MGCRIIHDREQNIAALYCSTSDVAFGPVFNEGPELLASARKQIAEAVRILDDM